MTEHKFTDEEIIKALECCCKDNYEGDCPKCPLQLNGNCNVILAEHALDLINRQKAEIAFWQDAAANAKREAAREIFEKIENLRVVGVYGIHAYLKEDVDGFKKKYTEEKE